jgi:hypothetical protein
LLPLSPGVTSGLPLQITDALGDTGDWEHVSHEQCSGQGYEIKNENGPTHLTAQLSIAVP